MFPNIHEEAALAAAAWLPILLDKPLVRHCMLLKHKQGQLSYRMTGLVRYSLFTANTEPNARQPCEFLVSPPPVSHIRNFPASLTFRL